ncbi:bifunctional protein-serine/threonine kinase/phosphatase [Telmatospirillum sp. J64-1]|uniref:bifunctional protein-serine/threonine kinase/phosphatase n=1 Tax=Telmatospirillum sp. J64-1 TaxID=2502183 RepID=UPI00115D6076|nr:bifunctional protein-serine/threonine kinase/phosphatase [Telmatospirillum sp. J64-1]
MTTGADLKVSAGVFSETGRRQRNEDFAASCLGTATERARQGIVAAIADGMGGARGGREAAELMVRGFIDGYYADSATLGVQRSASRILQPLNSWIHTQGRTDPLLAGMGCTFTALVLRGRTAHVIHVGDTRLYRLSGDRLLRLTEDHSLRQPGLSHVLYRAIGIEETVRLDYAAHPVAVHDRFLLCCDGIHGVLPDEKIADILRRRSAPEDSAYELVSAALEAGSDDNVTALVLDVLDLPPLDRDSIGRSILTLPMIPVPAPGDRIDGFVLGNVLSEGRYSRLFIAEDGVDGGKVVLKFPHPSVATEATYKAAFIREAWVAARVRSPWLASVIELPEGRQSCLYTVMPYYAGETLEQRLRRKPRPSLEEGRQIGIKLGKAVTALHRAGIIHRDIKPDNVILQEDGGLKLLDLGVVRIPGLEDFPQTDVPGTPSYMAPEMFAGQGGSETSDLYALGATLYRLYTGQFPQGEIEPFSHPRFKKVPSLARLRPDLPAWLDATLAKALALDPKERHGDVMELVLDLEGGPTEAQPADRRRPPLYHRNPVLFWQAVSGVLFLALLACLIVH